MTPWRVSRRSKYANRRVTLDGYQFASKREAGRYRALALELQAGTITNLRLQVPFVLHAQGGEVVGRYRADFCYTRDGQEVVEDAKGWPTPLYQWKKKHLWAEYGIHIVET